MTSQTRLALWDYITRLPNLPPLLKLILLVLANYSDSRSLKSRVPLSLLVRDCNLSEKDLLRLLPSLEVANLIEKLSIPAERHGPNIPLYNLSSPLLQAAKRRPPTS